MLRDKVHDFVHFKFTSLDSHNTQRAYLFHTKVVEGKRRFASILQEWHKQTPIGLDPSSHG